MICISLITIPYNTAYCGNLFSILIFMVAATIIMWTTYLCKQVLEDYSRKGVEGILMEGCVKECMGSDLYMITVVNIAFLCVGNIITYIIFIQNIIYIINNNIFVFGIPMEVRVLFIFFIVIPIFCIKDFAGIKNTCLAGNVSIMLQTLIILSN